MTVIGIWFHWSVVQRDEARSGACVVHAISPRRDQYRVSASMGALAASGVAGPTPRS